MKANIQHDPAENPEAKIILGKGAKQPNEIDLRVKYPALYDVESHKGLIFERLESFKRGIFFKIPIDFRNDEKLFAGISQKIDGVLGKIRGNLSDAHLSLQTSCEPLSGDEDEIERDFRIRTSLIPLNVVSAIGDEMSELQEVIDYVHRISEINQKRKSKERDKKELEDEFKRREEQTLDSFNKAMDIIGGEKLDDTNSLGANLSRRLPRIKSSQKIRQSPEHILPVLENYGIELGKFRKDQSKLSGLIKALALEEDTFKKYFSDGAEGNIPQMREDLFLDYTSGKNYIPGEIEKAIFAGQEEIITVVSLDAQSREDERREQDRLAKEAVERAKLADIARRKIRTWAKRIGVSLVLVGGIVTVGVLSNKDEKKRDVPADTGNASEKGKMFKLDEIKQKLSSFLGSRDSANDPSSRLKAMDMLAIVKSPDFKGLDNVIKRYIPAFAYDYPGGSTGLSEDKGDIMLRVNPEYLKVYEYLYGSNAVTVFAEIKEIGKQFPGEGDKKAVRMPKGVFCENNVNFSAVVKRGDEEMTDGITFSNHLGNGGICSDDSIKINLPLDIDKAQLDFAKKNFTDYLQYLGMNIPDKDKERINSVDNLDKLEQIVVYILGDNAISVTHLDDESLFINTSSVLNDAMGAIYSGTVKTSVVLPSTSDEILKQKDLPTGLSTTKEAFCAINDENDGLVIINERPGGNTRMAHYVNTTGLKEKICK